MRVVNFLEKLANYAKKIPTSESIELKTVARELSESAGGQTNSFGKLFSDIKKYKIVDQKLHLNETSLKSLYSDVKIGKIEKALTALGRNVKLSDEDFSSAIQMIRQQIKKYPKYHLNKIEESTVETLEHFNLKEDITDIEEFKRLIDKPEASIFKQIRSILPECKGFTLPSFKFTAGAVGVASFAMFIQRYREKMNGCFRYESKNDGGNLIICKVRQCTCKSSRDITEYTFCRNSDIPLVMQMAKCPPDSEKKNSSLVCVHCNSAENDPADIPINIEYRCSDVGYFGALFDFTASHIDAISGELDKLGNATGNASIAIIGYMKFIIPSIILFILICALVKVYYKRSANTDKSYVELINNRDDRDDLSSSHVGISIDH